MAQERRILSGCRTPTGIMHVTFSPLLTCVWISCEWSGFYFTFLVKFIFIVWAVYCRVLGDLPRTAIEYCVINLWSKKEKKHTCHIGLLLQESCFSQDQTKILKFKVRTSLPENSYWKPSNDLIIIIFCYNSYCACLLDRHSIIHSCLFYLTEIPVSVF